MTGITVALFIAFVAGGIFGIGIKDHEKKEKEKTEQVQTANQEKGSDGATKQE